jgi:hypothetical protein
MPGGRKYFRKLISPQCGVYDDSPPRARDGGEVDATTRSDMADVKSQSDIDTEVTRWAYTVAYERFDLLGRIAAEIAKAKGVKLPPKLSVAK